MKQVSLTRIAVGVLVLALAVTGLLFIGDALLYRPVWGQAIGPVLAQQTTPVGTTVRSPQDAVRVRQTASPVPGLTPSATSVSAPTATAAATMPPASAASSAAMLAGQILFLTDREGVDLWDWDGGGVVYVMNADGSNQRRLTRPGLYDELAQWEPWSHGRQQAAIVQWNKASSSYDLFVHNAADGWTLYATGGRAAEYSPAWSPMDNRIAYVTGEDGNDEIHVWNLDTRRDHRLTFDPQWDKHPTWSPDGTRLAFWSNRATGRKQIWCMTADGQRVRNLSDNPWNDWDPVWVK